METLNVDVIVSYDNKYDTTASFRNKITTLIIREINSSTKMICYIEVSDDILYSILDLKAISLEITNGTFHATLLGVKINKNDNILLHDPYIKERFIINYKNGDIKCVNINRDAQKQREDTINLILDQ